MKCQKCGTDNPSDKTFCTSCGEFLVDLVTSSERNKDGRPAQVIDDADLDKVLGEKRWKRWYFLIVGIIEVILGVGLVVLFHFLFPWLPFLWPLLAMFCVLMPAAATTAIYLGHYRTAAILYIISGVPLILAIAIGLLGFWAATHAFGRGALAAEKRRIDPDLERSEGFLIKVSPAKKIIVMVLVILTFVVPLAVAGAITAGCHPYVKDVLVPDERRVGQQISVHVYLSNMGLTSAEQGDIKIKFEGDSPVEYDWTGDDLKFGKGSLMKTFYSGNHIKSLKVLHNGEVVHEKHLNYRY